MPAPSWFRDARFGLFIHWGLYALPAGVWKGKAYDHDLGEWIMWHAKIPLAEYDQLAAQFHPDRFDARAWARLARAAGMRYLVFTAKHHDGFAMWDSRRSPRNVTAATPWRRDPVAELAAACAAEGLRFCLYYSHAIDWSTPLAAQHWADPGASTRDLARHFREVTLPEVTELLTRYGPIAVLWFDMPFLVTPELAEQLRAHVKRLQPDCLVNGRLGPAPADYRSFGDNVIPETVQTTPAETCATINNSWGYKSRDHAWKTPRELLETLLDLASKNVTYLLNVGPRADGAFPEPAVETLQSVGAWLHAHAEAVYDAEGIPNWRQPAHARLLRRTDGRYFLHVFSPDQPTILEGLSPAPLHALRLADHTPVAFTHHDGDLHLSAPGGDTAPCVVELTFAEPPAFRAPGLQSTLGHLSLAAHEATVHDGKLAFNDLTVGRVTGIVPRPGRLTWRFTLRQPARFRVSLRSLHADHRENGGRWQGGQLLRLATSAQTLEATLAADEPLSTPRSRYYDEMLSHFPNYLDLPAGEHTLSLERLDTTRGPLDRDQLVELLLTPA